MDKIIVTTPDELRAIVSEAVSGILPKQNSQPQIDTISMDDTLELLHEHSYPTSRAKFSFSSYFITNCKENLQKQHFFMVFAIRNRKIDNFGDWTTYIFFYYL